MKDAAADVKEGGYVISGEANNSNYEVTFIEGVYTIEKRALTVEIYDQTETYNYEHDYGFNEKAWNITAGELAEGEQRETLGVALTRAEGEYAGDYKITATWTNGNYALTFTGRYSSEGDADSGKAGVYTIAKQDVTETANFSLTVGNGGTLVGDVLKDVRYAGEPLAVAGFAAILEGEELRPLKVEVSQATIDDVGEYSITVTVHEPNYSGSAVIKVIVTDEEGYTLHLREVLARLEALSEGVEKDALSADDFAVLKEMQGLLKSLSEDELKVADVTEYEELVSAWNAAAEIEDVIASAVAIADAPIAGLMEAAAALTALAALAYIVMKGGIL